ncbi:DUF4012 domain-containing protein [Streptomyces sp. NPDC005931]|uniref:DUF4012 domain-containing protein n=1 Tax=Streptomyces sp. NPDC005931 TaxID=3364737 RepID=UPI003681AEA2
MSVLAGVPLAGVGWVAVTGLLARSELLASQQALESLQQQVAEGSPAAPAQGAGPPARHRTQAAVRAAAEHAARAHRLTSGPAWYAAAHVPVLGGPARTVRGAAEAADTLARHVIRPLAHTATALTAGTRADGPVNLSALRGAAPELGRAALSASDAREDVNALPRRTWLPSVDRARDRLLARLDRLVPATGDVAAAARVMPSMLGERGPRRYVVVFENTAEARGTGGLPGAFAVLTADRGRLAFESFGNDTEMAQAVAAVDLGDEYAALHGHNAPTSTWVNSNLSPHFPYAARIWAAAWRQHKGERVDGALALDPGALSGLLVASGPARLPDGTEVTAGNVVDLTERSSYAAYRDTRERKRFFLDVARAVAQRLLGAAGDPRRRQALFAALSGQLGEGRVKVWSAHGSEQRELQRRRFGGALPDTSDPLAGLIVNNAAGTKLDYYLDRRLEWAPGRCVTAGREVTATVRLTNRAPASGLPPYVTQRVDDPPYPTRPGDNRLLVSYYATKGARLNEAVLDGRPVLVQQAAERGRPVFTLDLELRAGATRTLVLHLRESASDRPPAVLRQPLVRPLEEVVRPPRLCGD